MFNSARKGASFLFSIHVRPGWSLFLRYHRCTFVAVFRLFLLVPPFSCSSLKDEPIEEAPGDEEKSDMLDMQVTRDKAIVTVRIIVIW